MKQWWKWREFWQMAFWVPAAIVSCSINAEDGFLNDGNVLWVLVGVFICVCEIHLFCAAWVKHEEAVKEGGE